MRRAGLRGQGTGLFGLMVAASVTLTACGATPPSPASLAPAGPTTAASASPGVGPSTAAGPTTASASPAGIPSTIPPVPLGGYRWIQVDPGQFGGIGLTAVTSVYGTHLFAIGHQVMAEAPDGTPRHPTAWTSTDGRRWGRLPDSQAFDSRRSGWEEIVIDIVPDGEGFVAVGMEQQGDASNADAAAWFSPDGTTWTRAKVADGMDRTMDQVVATDAGFVAIGEAGYDFHGGFGAGTAIWTSSDGRTWTRLADKEAPPRGTALRSIVAGTTGFFATASFEESQGAEATPRQPVTAGIWRSDDAIHWKPIPGTPLGVGQIVRGPDGFVAIGTGYAGDVAHPVAWRSKDGRTWTTVEVPLPSGLPAGTSIYGQLLATGTVGLVAFAVRDDDFSTVAWSSTDGAAWSPLDLTGILDGATINEAHATGGSILLLGDRTIDGTATPVTLLLDP